MRGSIIIVIMLILILIAPIAAVNRVAASSTSSTASTQAKEENDDILYLRRNNTLTTTAPTNATAATITVHIGSSTTVRWVNETTVPSGYNWTIASGTYNFTFWMEKDRGSPDATVSFSFGYIKPDGTIWRIIGGSTTIDKVSPRITQYSIIANTTAASIPSDSRLFIDVTISVSGEGTGAVIFYYDGTGQSTRIETPPISLVVVPEFPFGVVFLPPALLLAYLIFKRRAVKFRA